LLGATALAFALSFDEFIITFFVIGPDGTLPLYIWSALRRSVDPSINVVSTLLLALSLVLWVFAFVAMFRRESHRRVAVEAGLL
jgi:ABC-type spermidine/putrescine transport system permease subunit II